MSAREGGYTILEALVAFAILSVVLVALYGAAATSLQSVDRGARAYQVEMLARSKLDEFAADPAPLPHRGFGYIGGTDVSWRANASDIPDSFAGRTRIHLQYVELTLTWPEGTWKRGTFVLRTRHLGTERR